MIPARVDLERNSRNVVVDVCFHFSYSPNYGQTDDLIYNFVDQTKPRGVDYYLLDLIDWFKISRRLSLLLNCCIEIG
jgi:hypothetical protein